MKSLERAKQSVSCWVSGLNEPPPDGLVSWNKSGVWQQTSYVESAHKTQGPPINSDHQGCVPDVPTGPYPWCVNKQHQVTSGLVQQLSNKTPKELLASKNIPLPQSQSIPSQSIKSPDHVRQNGVPHMSPPCIMPGAASSGLTNVSHGRQPTPMHHIPQSGLQQHHQLQSNQLTNKEEPGVMGNNPPTQMMQTNFQAQPSNPQFIQMFNSTRVPSPLPQVYTYPYSNTSVPSSQCQTYMLSSMGSNLSLMYRRQQPCHSMNSAFSTIPYGPQQMYQQVQQGENYIWF